MLVSIQYWSTRTNIRKEGTAEEGYYHGLQPAKHRQLEHDGQSVANGTIRKELQTALAVKAATTALVVATL